MTRLDAAVREEDGLRVFELAAADAGPRVGEVPRGVHVVRVNGVEAGDHGHWEGRGFTVRPAWVTWVSQPGADEAEYLHSLSRKVRQDVTRARARVGDVEFQTVTPIRAQDLDEFLRLYRDRVSAMPHGVDYASATVPGIVDAADHVLMRARVADRLDGGVICQMSPGGLFKLRFSAVTERARRNSLARVLYLRAFDVAREQELVTVTLGNDPNRYGGLAQPGLFAFKCHLGFRCVPAAQTTPALGGDVAERWLTPPPTEPYFSLAYHDEGFELHSTSEVKLAHVPGVPWITRRSVVPVG